MIRVTFKPCCASLAAAFAFLTFLDAVPARAQSAGQLVEPSYAPDPRRPGVGIQLPASTGIEAPEGAELLFVTPSGLVVDGGLPALASQTAGIDARLRGKRVSGAELFAAARDLEAAYAAAGYVLVRVTLPPQTIVDNQPLKLVVTDGFIERVDTGGLPQKVRERVEKLTADLVTRRGITRADIERRLLLAGDIPGLALRSTLRAGEAAGATILVLEGTHDPLAVTVSTGSGQTDDIGGYTASLGVDLNNIAGLGEITYLRFSGYPGFIDDHLFSDTPRNRQMTAGLLIPLGIGGLSFNIEGTDAHSLPDSGDLLQTEDHYQRLSSRFSYQWVRSRLFNTATELTFDVINEDKTLIFGTNQTPFAEDRLRVLRLSQTVDYLTADSAAIDARLAVSFGIDGLGARHATADLPMTRTGAEPDFKKLDASLLYRKALLERFDFRFSTRAQTSFGEALPSSEQIGFGGNDALSSFDPGTLQGDSGILVRMELGYPVGLPSWSGQKVIGGVLAPYIFGAAGIVELAAPSSLEQKVTRGGSVGLGLRLNLSDEGLAENTLLTVEYAHGWADGSSASDRVTLGAVFRF